MPFFASAQWHNTCADEGYLQIEEDGPVTKFWIEGAYLNCYGQPNSRWQEFWFYCQATGQHETYKVSFGDTLEMEIGKGIVVAGAGTMYGFGGVVYEMLCPSVEISGLADVECFERHTEPISPPPPPSYVFEQGCITPSTGAVLIWRPILYPMAYSAVEIDAGGVYCLEKGNCFYLLYLPFGATSEIVCF